MKEAKLLHAYIITNGLQLQEPYLRKLITILAFSNNSSCLNYARVVFDSIESPSTFIYNAMIRACASSTDPKQALHIYTQMHKNSYPPDKYTFPFLLKACSVLLDLKMGEEIQCQILKHGLDSDIYVQNSLIHFYGSNSKIETAHRIFNEMGDRDIASWTTLVSCYANFGSIDLARRLFDKIPKRSAVSYSAMLTGYVRCRQFKKALELFRYLQVEGVEPNDSTLMCVLCACANLGALDTGRWIHSYINKRKGSLLNFDTRITTALIDMYFKCGSINEAVNVFVGAKEKHVGEWTAMISGMAVHGLGYKSIELFEDMVRSGIKPNIVTFVSLLSGCAHAGLVDEGLMYYERMESEFGITPSIEHFGCIVDLLGRAGLINEAVEFITRMPVQANVAICGSLLNSCRVHGNVEIGEFVARRLIHEEQDNGALYMSLLSLYKEAGRWGDVKKVKWEMKRVGCRKSPGCSLIEVSGLCYEFVVGDKSYPYVLEVCFTLEQLVSEVDYLMPKSERADDHNIEF